jgi:hypothetical protein
MVNKMNKKELKNKLDELGIGTNNYELDGDPKPSRYILSHVGSKWQTFAFDEHGNISEKREFDSEDEACQDMLDRLIYLVEWRKKYNIK